MALKLFLTSLEYQVKPDYAATPYTSDNLLRTSGKTPLKTFHWNKAHTGHEPADNLDFLLTYLCNFGFLSPLGYAAYSSEVSLKKGKHYISFLDAENSTFTSVSPVFSQYCWTLSPLCFQSS